MGDIHTVVLDLERLPPAFSPSLILTESGQPLSATATPATSLIEAGYKGSDVLHAVQSDPLSYWSLLLFSIYDGDRVCDLSKSK